MFVCGDDDALKPKVTELVAQLGFETKVEFGLLRR